MFIDLQSCCSLLQMGGEGPTTSYDEVDLWARLTDCWHGIEKSINPHTRLEVTHCEEQECIRRDAKLTPGCYAILDRCKTDRINATGDNRDFATWHPVDLSQVLVRVIAEHLDPLAGVETAPLD